MVLYKLNECDDGDLTPEDKAEELALMRKYMFEYTPSELLKYAEWLGFLPDLLNDLSAKELTPEKIAYISSSSFMFTQLENLIRQDDKDKFAAFLTEYHDLVLSFPTCEVLSLLCWHNAPACVSALLDSPLRAEVDVNGFGTGPTIPLEVAASKLSLPLVKTLLSHGADPDVNCERCLHSTVLNTALVAFRSHELVKECIVKDNTMDLISTLCNAALEEAVDVTSLLAFHSKNVYSILSQLIDDMQFTEMTILLFAARNKLLAPSGDWTFKETPVAKLISRELKQVESARDIKMPADRKGRLTEARMIAESIWKACDSKEIPFDFDSWHQSLSQNTFKGKKKHSKGKRSSSSRPTWMHTAVVKEKMRLPLICGLE